MHACCAYLIKQAIAQAQMDRLVAQYDAQERARAAARFVRRGQMTPIGGGRMGQAVTRGLKVGLPLAGLATLGYGLYQLR